MSQELRCGFCGHETDGLTLYSVAGAFRLLVCESCYGVLVAKEHQPYSKPMKWLHRLLGLNGKEVVTHEGTGRYHTALGHSPSAVAQEKTQLAAVSVVEPGVGFVSRNTWLRGGKD